MTALTQYIIKEVDESRYDETAGMLDDAELTLALTAGTYWVEANALMVNYEQFASGAIVQLGFSGTLDADGIHHVMAERAWMYYTTSFDGGYAYEVSNFTTDPTYVSAPASIYSSTDYNSAHRGACRIWGRITVATAGNLKLQWQHTDNGFAGSSRPSTMKQGSWLYATPLDICPI